MGALQTSAIVRRALIESVLEREIGPQRAPKDSSRSERWFDQRQNGSRLNGRTTIAFMVITSACHFFPGLSHRCGIRDKKGARPDLRGRCSFRFNRVAGTQPLRRISAAARNADPRPYMDKPPVSRVAASPVAYPVLARRSVSAQMLLSR
jgi:hypothetical protein